MLFSFRKTLPAAVLALMALGACQPHKTDWRDQVEDRYEQPAYRSPDFTAPLPEGRGVGLLDFVRQSARREAVARSLKNELSTYRDQVKQEVHNSSYYHLMDRLPLLRETIREQTGRSRFDEQRRQALEQEMASVPPQ